MFPNVPVVGFHNGKILKDYLVRAAPPKTNETGRCEENGKKTCLVCNSIRTTTTFTTEACGEIFKIQSGPLNGNSEKVLYLLKCKVYGEAAYVGKAKTKFRYRFNNYKSKHRAFRKGNRKIPQNFFHDHYCVDGHLEIDDWDFTLFEQCQTCKQLKDRETFCQHRLKTFYSLGPHEKELYLYSHTPHMRVRQSIMKEFRLSFSFINFSVINLFKFVC